MVHTLDAASGIKLTQNTIETRKGTIIPLDKIAGVEIETKSRPIRIVVGMFLTCFSLNTLFFDQTAFTIAALINLGFGVFFLLAYKGSCQVNLVIRTVGQHTLTIQMPHSQSNLIQITQLKHKLSETIATLQRDQKN